MLSTLTMNKLFVQELMETSDPCLAMGFVEENGDQIGFIALRPDEAIPQDSASKGFAFGHSILNIVESPTWHFAFDFYGFKTFHTLTNPTSPVVKSVLSKMLQTNDYFFFAINPDQSVIAFRSPIDPVSLESLKRNFEIMENLHCLPSDFEAMCESHKDELNENECFLKWVCRDNEDYLDLTQNRLELTPN